MAEKSTKKSTRKVNKKLIIFSCLTLVVVAVLGAIFYNIISNATSVPAVDEKVVLDDSEKNTDGKMIEIADKTDDIENYTTDLINSNKEIVFLISNQVCSEETAQFREYVKKYQRDKHLSFYYITSDHAKKIEKIGETIKYYPTVVIFKDGKIKNYLHFDSNNDKQFYKSYDGFARWFEANVEYK